MVRSMLSPEALRLLSLLGPEPVEVDNDTLTKNAAARELANYRLIEAVMSYPKAYLRITREGSRLSEQYSHIN